VKVGDRVLLMGRNNWASIKRDKAKALLPVPEALDVGQAAMLKINPATAFLMVNRYGGLKAGDWLIQNAANSGVGRLVIRIAKAQGFNSVAVVRRKELAKPLEKIGADAVVMDGDDLAKRVKAATRGADIRLAIDAVAGAATLRLSECLGDGGTVVNYGRLSGEPCQVSPNRVIFAGVTLTGFWLVRHLGAMDDGARASLYAELAKRVASGELTTEVEAVHALVDINQALAEAARDGRDGKVLVRP
jgi:mitochondrial enoyl-[acyl-carrier protein] reductase / trans-2-enoyl-CoA reductase